VIRINENYLKLKSSYLFVEIAKRVSAYQGANPNNRIIKLGIGDVTEPLPKACIAAFHSAVEELGKDETFKGYGPEQGYPFLRQAIAENDFASRGAPISAEEIFVSDGSKCDTGNFQELFSQDITLAVSDPVYPVYLDTNVMAGRTDKVLLLPSTRDNGFVPSPPKETADLVYLCFPNNPTGATAGKAELEEWVDYARRNRALLLFDAAYESFIRDKEIPHSIYEIPGAEEVAVEFRSFSKTAGFTGTRCAYTVVPKKVMAYDSKDQGYPLWDLWNRRQSTKFNGVSYPVQKAAAAIYTPEGKREVKALSDYYLGNAAIIRKTFLEIGLEVTGGDNSPYIWIATGKDSWDFFDSLLHKAEVVCTPGSGFGKSGEGYVRISAFNKREKVQEALERIRKIL